MDCIFVLIIQTRALRENIQSISLIASSGSRSLTCYYRLLRTSISTCRNHMIGDSERDVEAGRNAGCKDSFLIETNHENALLEQIKAIIK